MNPSERTLTRQRLELLAILAGKELKVRYKTTLLGFLWSFLVPFSLMLVFLMVFRFLMHLDISPTFLLTGLFPWTFFAFSISTVVASFTGNGDLIKKVRFPRELLPASVVLANLFNFVLSMLILLLFDIRWTPWLLLVPAVIVLQFLFTLGLALVVAAANVYYRDVKYLVEIGLNLWFYLTPIFYPLDLVQSKGKTLLYLFLLNPMTGLTVMYRDFIYNGICPSRTLLIVTVALCLIVFCAGNLLFWRLKRNLADYV